MLRAQRPQARRALSLRTQALDLVALILDLLMLLEELGTPRVRVFLLAHPGSLLLLDQVFSCLQTRRERARVRRCARQRSLGIRELRDAAIQHVEIARQLGDLRLFFATGGILTVQSVQLGELGFAL